MATVTRVLENLDKYLRDNLSVDSRLASELFGWKPTKLIDWNALIYIRAQFVQGNKDECFQQWRDFAGNYDVPMLEEWCKCLKKHSESAKPKLKDIAIRVEEELREVQKQSALSDHEHQLADTSKGTNPLNSTECATGPSNGLFSSRSGACSSSTIGKVTASNIESHRDGGRRKMQALNEIYCSWRDSSTTAPLELKLPRNLSLEKKFDNLLVSIKEELCRLRSSGLDAKLSRLYDLIGLKCSRRKRAHGADCLLAPVTPEAALECIAKESHIFDPVVVHQVIDDMENANLKSELEGYEKYLKSVCCTTFTSNSHPTINLQHCGNNHVHMAVCSSEQTSFLLSLSMINNMKFYFKDHLKLDDIFFDGYRNGCIIVYFTISKEDIPNFRLIILSLAQDLQKQFDLTQLIVFDHFVCDLEQKTIIDTQRLEPPECQTVAQDLTSKDYTESTGLMFWENENAQLPVTWGTLNEALEKAELANELPPKEKLIQLLEEFPSKPDDLFIGKKIGTGSKGVVVHKGKYQGKDVAVKIIPDLLFYVDNEDELETEAKKVHKFLKEVQLLKQIGHEHIVKYFGAFYDRDTQEPMLVMELMSKTLKAYLKKHKKTLILSKQVNICLQIAEGVKFLHHQQPPMAHRDLTNTNVLVSESEDSEIFKIGDLGQAKLKPEVNRRYFSTETPGSLAYMPPEVHGGSPHYTESIDIFSLGVLMVEVATQSPPTVTIQGIGTISEFERREADLDLMGAQHPLKPIAVQCLEDNYKHRLRIDEVFNQLTALVKRCSQEQASDEENADNGSMYEPPTHVASRRDLIDGINLYLQAARAFTAHQDSGKQLLTDAANYLKKAIDNFAAARITGKVLGTAGGVLGVVGVGLLLGVITSPAAVPLLAVGVALGVAGGVTTAGALTRAVRVMKNSLALEKANQWTEEYKELSKALLKRLKEFQEVLSSVSQNYNESEETCLNTALKGIIGKRGAQITLESFQSAHEQATPVFVQWKAVLQTGAQALAKGVLAAATEVGASTTKASTTRGANITPVTVDVGAETTGAVTVDVDTETTGAVTVEVDAETTGAGTVEVDAETTGVVTLEVGAEMTGGVTMEDGTETTGAVTVDVGAETTGAVTVEVGAETTCTVTMEVGAETTGAVTVDVGAETTGAVTVEVGAETTGGVTMEVGAETTGAVTKEVGAETTGAVTVEVGAETTGAVTVEVGAETTGTVTMEVGTETTGAVTVDVGAETTGAVTVEVGAETTGAITRGVVSGVEATAEVGATVGRTVLTVAGGEVVGLSAAFIAINLDFLIETGHDIYKNKGVTTLAIALREIIEDMNKQPEELQPLANLRQ